MWTMGDDIVKENIIYKHLEISLNTSLSTDYNVKKAALLTLVFIIEDLTQ